MKTYLLAHDLGTSGNKATLFTDEGTLVSSRVYSYKTYFFNGNWAEQDAKDWWKAVCVTTKELIMDAAIDPGCIAVVSFSGQMMGCLCVDKAGTALRRSIIWADQRAQKQSDELEEMIPQKAFYRLSGHRNTASYGIQKLMWIKDNEPEIYKNTYKVLNAKDYIVFCLTGLFYTDYSDGNSMGCFDLLGFRWSKKILEAAGIPESILPELKPSTYVAGKVTKAAALQTGLKEGTQVVLGAGDGVASSVGAGSIEPGRTFSCMGTSAWITTTSKEPIFDEQMRTVTWAHMIPGLYAPNGTMQSAGGAYQWVKNNLCNFETQKAHEEGAAPYEIMNNRVSESKPGANGILFLPYLMGERAPRWDYDAKGAFIGIKSENTGNDMLRSVLEGVTMNMEIILKTLESQVPIEEIVVVGGGAKSNVWRQMMADIYNKKILVPTVLEEAGAMGAAVAGGVGVGLYQDFSQIHRFLKIKSINEPQKDAVEKYEACKEIFDDCYYALQGIFKRLH